MFSEERLDLGYDYGTVVTIAAKTSIVERGNGREQRTIDWHHPLLTFNVGQYSTINEQLEYFINFHRARKGAFEGFRFKDWSDYLVVNQFLAIGDGEVTEFQLYKTYQVGNWQAHRPITKPVAETLRVFLDSVELTEGWELDTTTGILTFDEAPDGEIWFSCEFDVPVRFTGDEINLRFEAYEQGTQNKIFNWEGLTLQEIRLPFGNIPVATIPQNLDHQINLGYDYGTVGGAKFSTRIDGSANGQEVRSSNWSSPKARWEIGQRSLLLEELKYLISLFRVARGRAVQFSYLDRASETVCPVRFGEDNIAFRFDAYDRFTGAAIFNLSGVPLVGLPFNNFFGILSGLRWEFPCIGSVPNRPDLCQCPQSVNIETTLQGDDSFYFVTLRFRGVVELNSHYENGTADGFFQIGGNVGSGNNAQGLNIYRLTISNPAQIYYLNRGNPVAGRLTAIDYLVTIPIYGNATVSLDALADPDFGQQIGSQINNALNTLMPGVPPFPSAFNGQFLQMDVENVD
jgi:uncharacterized protein (TIGR02217 family)